MAPFEDLTAKGFSVMNYKSSQSISPRHKWSIALHDSSKSERCLFEPGHIWYLQGKISNVNIISHLLASIQFKPSCSLTLSADLFHRTFRRLVNVRKLHILLNKDDIMQQIRHMTGTYYSGLYIIYI